MNRRKLSHVIAAGALAALLVLPGAALAQPNHHRGAPVDLWSWLAGFWKLGNLVSGSGEGAGTKSRSGDRSERRRPPGIGGVHGAEHAGRGHGPGGRDRRGAWHQPARLIESRSGSTQLARFVRKCRPNIAALLGKGDSNVGETMQRRSAADRALDDSDVELNTVLDVPVQARALAGLSRRERGRYRRARALLAAEGSRSLPLADMSVVGPGVCEAFLAQSWSVRFDNPEEMVHLAEIAVDIARDLAGSHQAGRTADLQARAWGELANAFRTADRLRSAQWAFGEAYAFLRRGTGDPYLKARLFDLEASLLGTLREIPMALRRLSSLANLYQDLGETHLAGRSLITSALYTFYNGDAAEAVEINQRGSSLIDQSQDPTLFMLALHNHLLYLVDLKLYPKAQRLLFDNRRNLLYKDRISALRLRWVEGRINYGTGNSISAEIAFREAKEGFSSEEMSFHAAVLALELAMALRSLDRTEEALQEVIAAREIFFSIEIYREYLGAVIFLEELFSQGEATAEIIEDTVDQINRKWLQSRPRRMR